MFILLILMSSTGIALSSSALRAHTHFPGETYRNHTSFSEPEIQQTYAGQESASDLSRMHLRQLVETTLVQV